MKYLLSKLSFTLVLTLAMCATTLAQSPVEDLVKKYSGTEGYTSITLSEYMFQLFSTLADEDDEEFEEITNQLTGIKLLTVDSIVNLNRKKSFYYEMTNAMKGDAYKDLMVIQDGTEEIKMVVRENGDKISEFVMIGQDFLIALTGDIDLKKISQLSESLEIDGMEHLEKVEIEMNEKGKVKATATPGGDTKL